MGKKIEQSQSPKDIVKDLQNLWWARKAPSSATVVKCFGKEQLLVLEETIGQRHRAVAIACRNLGSSLQIAGNKVLLVVLG